MIYFFARAHFQSREARRETFLANLDLAALYYFAGQVIINFGQIGYFWRDFNFASAVVADRRTDGQLSSRTVE